VCSCVSVRKLCRRAVRLSRQQAVGLCLCVAGCLGSRSAASLFSRREANGSNPAGGGGMNRCMPGGRTSRGSWRGARRRKHKRTQRGRRIHAQAHIGTPTDTQRHKHRHRHRDAVTQTQTRRVTSIQRHKHTRTQHTHTFKNTQRCSHKHIFQCRFSARTIRAAEPALSLRPRARKVAEPTPNKKRIQTTTRQKGGRTNPASREKSVTKKIHKVALR